MSITSALNAALTGLTATSRQAAVISANVANASTPGYARRSVSLSSLNLGGQGNGVRVVGIMRHSDVALLNDRRGADASYSASAARANSLAQIEALLGTSGSEGAITAKIAAFDSALLEAASRPESQPRLEAAVQAAKGVVASLHTAADGIQRERLQADKAIGAAVDLINRSLEQIEQINNHIASYRGANRDTAALEDERQYLIDQISTLVPIRELPRDGDRVALVTAGGAILLDGKAATLGFTSVNTIVAEMSQASGALSGLTYNGQPMATSGAANLFAGGELHAMFQIRDEIAVEAQAQIDALARDFIDRFNDPTLDPTIGSSAMGLFTDRYVVFDPAQEVGISSRIMVNAALDPELGGVVTRLRDGLGALTPGPIGSSSLLTALSERLNESRSIASATVSGHFSSAGLAAQALSKVASQRLLSQNEQSYNLARLTALADIEAANGVDIDAQMQFLLVVENNWAANAKVIAAADEMINILLGL